MSGKSTRPAIERFEEKYIPEPNSGCWLWTGVLHGHGYGSFFHRGKNVQAHRFSYETTCGEIPEGLHIDHLCRTPACVNPLHLEPVTQRENVLRGVGLPALLARRSHCEKGHPLTMRNPQYRWCRVCANELRRIRRAAISSLTPKRPRLRDRFPDGPPKGSRIGKAHITHCAKGHPYTADNTKIDGHGWRRCRICFAASYARAKLVRQEKRAISTRGAP